MRTSRLLFLIAVISFKAQATECSLYQGNQTDKLITKINNHEIWGGPLSGPASAVFEQGKPKLAPAALVSFGDDWIVVQEHAGEELKSLDSGDKFKMVVLDENMEVVTSILDKTDIESSRLYIKRWGMTLLCRH